MYRGRANATPDILSQSKTTSELLRLLYYWLHVSAINDHVGRGMEIFPSLISLWLWEVSLPIWNHSLIIDWFRKPPSKIMVLETPLFRCGNVGLIRFCSFLQLMNLYALISFLRTFKTFFVASDCTQFASRSTPYQGAPRVSPTNQQSASNFIEPCSTKKKKYIYIYS
jgi:hypothetical protein